MKVIFFGHATCVFGKFFRSRRYTRLSPGKSSSVVELRHLLGLDGQGKRRTKAGVAEQGHRE